MPRIDTDLLGSHLSVAGGYVRALHEAKKLNLNSDQIFTKNQRQWKASPLDPAAVNDWLTQLHALGWTRTVSHASYLINLATPDNDLHRRGINAMIDELERAEALEVPYIVLHPGSHMNSGEEVGIKRIATAIDRVIKATSGLSSLICLETTVGGGTQIGGRFEHIAAIRSSVAVPERVAVCLDTCHITAAGYDISTSAKARAVFDEFDSIIGLDHLACLHMNDSMTPLGSHRDRHEHIGDGHVGKPGFKYLMNHPRLARLPMILETKKGVTEKGTPLDAINIRRLRSMVDPKGTVTGRKRASRQRQTAASGR